MYIKISIKCDCGKKGNVSCEINLERMLELKCKSCGRIIEVKVKK